MDIIKVYAGVTFHRRQNEGLPSRYFYDGGPMGGVIFVSHNGKYGSAGNWFVRFEDAARVWVERRRKEYAKHKTMVDAYERQRANNGKEVTTGGNDDEVFGSKTT